MSASNPTVTVGFEHRFRPPLTSPWEPGVTVRAVTAAAWRSGTARAGFLLLALLAFAAILGPALIADGTQTLVPARRLLPPSTSHWLGTDDLGRDVLARLLLGARTSLLVAVLVGVTTVVLGVVIGMVAAGARRADGLLMRAMDGVLAFPTVLLALAVVVRLGPGLPTVLLALILGHLPVVARLVRAATLTVLAMPHVEAARAIGAGPVRIAVRHVLPSTVSPILAQGTFVAGLAVLSEASLAFLGVGADAALSWGALLRDGQRLLGVAWWIAVPAGVAISLMVLAWTLIGDGLRDALDPRSRARLPVRR